MAATYRTSAAGGGTSGTVDRTAVITPAVGDLFLAFCNASGNTNAAPTCSDNNGGTYTRVGTALKNGSADILSVFVRDQLLANTTSTTVTVATGSNTAAEVVVVAFAGMLRTGSSAVRGSGFQVNQAASTTPAPALGAAALTSNPTLIAVANGTAAGSVWAPPTGWTERQDVSQSTPTTGLEVATRDSGFTGTSSTTGAGTSASAFASVILELDSSSAPRTGTAALVAKGQTLAGVGVVAYKGTASLTAKGQTLAATGVVTAKGTGALTAKGQTLAASATYVGPTRTAAASLTAAPQTLAAAVVATAGHPVARLTQLSQTATPSQAYAGFAGKATTPPVYTGGVVLVAAPMTLSGAALAFAPHPVAALTQLSPLGLAGRRYGLFSGRLTSSSFGSAVLSAKAQTLAGTGTVVAPAFTAPAALVAKGQTLAATATRVVPVFSGVVSLTTGPQTLAGTGHPTPPVFTGASALVAAPQTLAATGHPAPPVGSAGGVLTAKGQTLAGTGTVVAPVFTGSGGLTAKAQTLAGGGLFAAVVRSGAGVLTAKGQTLAATATYTLPARAGVGSLVAGPQALAAAASRTVPIFAGAVSLLAGPQVLVAEAPEVFRAAGSLTAAAAVLGAYGTVVEPEPVLPVPGDDGDFWRSPPYLLARIFRPVGGSVAQNPANGMTLYMTVNEDKTFGIDFTSEGAVRDAGVLSNPVVDIDPHPEETGTPVAPIVSADPDVVPAGSVFADADGRKIRPGKGIRVRVNATSATVGRYVLSCRVRVTPPGGVGYDTLEGGGILTVQ